MVVVVVVVVVEVEVEEETVAKIINVYGFQKLRRAVFGRNLQQLVLGGRAGAAAAAATAAAL